MAAKRSLLSTLGGYIDLPERLLDNYETLTKKLEVNKVIPRLIEERILSIEDNQEIMAHTTSQEKAQALLDKVITRGDCTISLFVAILRLSGHGHLADMLEGEPNSKVARTEGYKDMTNGQLRELTSRLQKIYREEVERHEESTSLEGLMGYEMGDAEPWIQVRKRTGRVIQLLNIEQMCREPLDFISWVYTRPREEPGHQVSTALAADWVGDKKVTSGFKEMYKLKLDEVRKDDTITDAIFDQLLHDSKYKPSFSKETLWRHMEQTQEEILFVLEGLDRLSPFTSQEILQLIDKKLLPRATVIVTVAEASGG